jgi:hypothetical protein
MRREFRYTPQHAAKAYILQQAAGLDCEADIKSHFDWNCIDPWPEWPDIDSPAIGHCFCHNRDVAERYWKCYYGKVIPCTRETIDLEWIYSKLSELLWPKLTTPSGGVALAEEYTTILPGQLEAKPALSLDKERVHGKGVPPGAPGSVYVGLYRREERYTIVVGMTQTLVDCMGTHRTVRR